MRKVTIRIRRDGMVEAETHGMKGRDCLPYILQLEDLLEAEAVDSDYTAEYYEGLEVIQEAPITEQEELRIHE